MRETLLLHKNDKKDLNGFNLIVVKENVEKPYTNGIVAVAVAVGEAQRVQSMVDNDAESRAKLQRTD